MTRATSRAVVVLVALLGLVAAGTIPDDRECADQWWWCARSRLRAGIGGRSRRGNLPRRRPAGAVAVGGTALHVVSYQRLTLLRGVRARPWPPELAVHVTPRPVGSAGGNPIVLGGSLFGDHPTAFLLDDLSLLPADARVIGPLVFDFGTSITGDGDLVIMPWCPTPGVPMPWEPPTAAEIWEQTPLPRRPIVASPPGTTEWPGITRLTTYFSSDPRPPTTAAVAIDGFAVTVAASPIAYAWTFGDGSTRIVGEPADRDRALHPSQQLRRHALRRLGSAGAPRLLAVGHRPRHDRSRHRDAPRIALVPRRRSPRRPAHHPRPVSLDEWHFLTARARYCPPDDNCIWSARLCVRSCGCRARHGRADCRCTCGVCREEHHALSGDDHEQVRLSGQVRGRTQGRRRRVGGAG